MQPNSPWKGLAALMASTAHLDRPVTATGLVFVSTSNFCLQLLFLFTVEKAFVFEAALSPDMKINL